MINKTQTTLEPDDHRLFVAQLSERNKALTDFDMEWARRMMPHASNDHVRVMSMHKARYECTQIAKELRTESGEWLREHGYKRLTGDAIMPKGELPE